MRAFRPRLSLWLLAACWSVAPCPTWSQGPMSRDSDVAMLDAFAALFFNLEAGHPTMPLAEPVRREMANGAVSYVSIEPSSLYGEKKKEYQDRAGSKYVRHHFVFKLTTPCVIRVDDTFDFSLKESREVFGQRVTRIAALFDLGKQRHLEFRMIGVSEGAVLIKGDKVWCDLKGQTRACHDSYIVKHGAAGADERDSFATRRYKAADLIRMHCPLRPG